MVWKGVLRERFEKKARSKTVAHRNCLIVPARIDGLVQSGVQSMLDLHLEAIYPLDRSTEYGRCGGHACFDVDGQNFKVQGAILARIILEWSWMNTRSFRLSEAKLSNFFMCQ